MALYIDNPYQIIVSFCNFRISIDYNSSILYVLSPNSGRETTKTRKENLTSIAREIDKVSHQLNESYRLKRIENRNIHLTYERLGYDLS